MKMNKEQTNLTYLINNKYKCLILIVIYLTKDGISIEFKLRNLMAHFQNYELELFENKILFENSKIDVDIINTTIDEIKSLKKDRNYNLKIEERLTYLSSCIEASWMKFQTFPTKD